MLERRVIRPQRYRARSMNISMPSADDAAKDLNRQIDELEAKLDRLERQHRRRKIRSNLGWALAGAIAGLRGKKPPKQPRDHG